MYHHIHSLKELEKEIHILNTGLEELRKEVSYHHDNPSYEPDDKFLVVMEPFLEEAARSFEKMEKTKVEMKEKVTMQCHHVTPCDLLFSHQQFQQAVILFGEDPDTTTILDFFPIFSNFLTSFSVG